MPGQTFTTFLDHAHGQYGYLTPDDARDLGVDPVQLRLMAARGTIEPRGHGLYRMREVPLTELDAYMEAVLWTRRRGVLSHETALDLHDLCDVNPAAIHLIVPKGFRTRKDTPPAYRLHYADLTPDDVRLHEGLPIVTAELAILGGIEQGLGWQLIDQAVKNARARGLITRHVAMRLGNRQLEARAARRLAQEPQTPPITAKPADRSGRMRGRACGGFRVPHPICSNSWPSTRLHKECRRPACSGGSTRWSSRACFTTRQLGTGRWPNLWDPSRCRSLPATRPREAPEKMRGMGSRIVSDRLNIYWTNNFTGTIGRAQLDGTGIDESFIIGAQNLIAVAVHGDHIYWTNVGPGGLGNGPIGRARLDGTKVEQDWIIAGGPAGVVVEGEHIYWTNDGEAGALGGGQSVGRARLDGTHVEQSFITGASNPNGIAANRTHVYWANAGSGTVGRAKLDGTEVNQSFITEGFIVSPPGDPIDAIGPVGLAIDCDHLYWTTDGAIGRARLDGTHVDQGFITSAGEPRALAVDRSHVFWANGNSAIGRARLDGAHIDPSFINGANGPQGVAVTGVS
jgi:virginiamycin B lyase